MNLTVAMLAGLRSLTAIGGIEPDSLAATQTGGSRSPADSRDDPAPQSDRDRAALFT
jgi:hypothetical protein